MPKRDARARSVSGGALDRTEPAEQTPLATTPEEGVRWVDVVVDLTPEQEGPGTEYWSSLVGGGLAGSVRPGRAGVHVDLYVDDVDRALDHALRHGAVLLSWSEEVTMSSPHGLRFCFLECPGGGRRGVPWASHETRPSQVPSQVDRLCLDVPRRAWPAERTFWSGVTRWDVRPAGADGEIELGAPDQGSIRFVLQRRHDDRGPTRAHLDLQTTDRPAEVLRHEGLGGRVLATHDEWTVLADPNGTQYCLRDAAPGATKREHDDDLRKE